MIGIEMPHDDGRGYDAAVHNSDGALPVDRIEDAAGNVREVVWRNRQRQQTTLPGRPSRNALLSVNTTATFEAVARAFGHAVRARGTLRNRKVSTLLSAYPELDLFFASLTTPEAWNAVADRAGSAMACVRLCDQAFVSARAYISAVEAEGRPPAPPRPDGDVMTAAGLQAMAEDYMPDDAGGVIGIEEDDELIDAEIVEDDDEPM